MEQSTEHASPVEPTASSSSTERPLTLQELHLFISMHSLSNGWVDQTKLEKITLCKLSEEASTSTRPAMVTHSLVINSDLTWKCFFHGHEVKDCPPLHSFPDVIDPPKLQQLIGALDSCYLCPGNPDKHFLSMSSERKGKFLSVKQEVTAYEDTSSVIKVDGEEYDRTIRTSGCTIISNGRCPSCAKFRPSLRAMYSRWQRKTLQFSQQIQ